VTPAGPRELRWCIGLEWLARSDGLAFEPGANVASARAKSHTTQQAGIIKIMKHHTLPVAALVVVVATALAHAQVKKMDMPGVSNFSRVDATIGCGGATQPAAMAALRKAGFNSVINLRTATEKGADIDAGRTAAESAGLKYIHLPFDSANPDPTLVETFLAAVSDTANQPVYIHCGSANRVAAVWMIKRVLRDGWSMGRALEEAEAIGLTSAPLKTFAVEYIERHKQ
jgi:uncharacterized protein (TIGR01244 family)